MKSLLWLAMTLCLAGLASYRIIAITWADRLAAEAPQRALDWLPGHPQALLVLAEQQLAQGDVEAARLTARRLLLAEPLEGRGFRILAAAAAKSGEPAQALALYKIAARRSPRDTATRAWLTEHYLVGGDYRAALAQIDAILRKAPTQERVLLPLLVKMSADPAFTVELVRVLKRRPLWRPALLANLQEADNPHAGDRVLSALRQQAGLTDAELDGWIERLMRQGRWGEAYSHWATTLDPGQPRLTAVYNGNFALRPGNRGFDWRVSRQPGVGLEFIPVAWATGLAARASFRDRPVPALNLEQPLLLAPGAYRLSVRMRAAGLTSEQGLQWTVVCDGAAEPVGTSAGIGGTFDWRVVTAGILIPSSECAGQWLRLRNPAPSGSGQRVTGELWLDDISIVPLTPMGNPVATLRIGRGKVMASTGGGFSPVQTGAPLATGQRLLLMDDAVARVDYPGPCTQRFRGAGVHVIDRHCRARPVVDTGPGPGAASRIAAGLRIEQAILGNMDGRDSPPAGR